MRYSLISPDGTLLRTLEFDIDPPQLAAGKGRWLPDIRPAHNPRTHRIAPVLPVPDGVSAVTRYTHETAGVVHGGVVISTDRESQAALTGAYTALKSGLVSEVQWKGQDGWLTLGLSQIEPIAARVAGYVQTCFARERELATQIQQLAGDPEAVIEFSIDTGWPE